MSTDTKNPRAAAAARSASPWDGWVISGLTIVALTAFVASFSTLAQLAGVAGWGRWPRWLLPFSIDALALAAARVWLSGRAPEPARRYARVVALCAVATSVVGNALGHLVGTGYLRSEGTAGVLLVIAVGSVPAIALGAVAHLATLAGVPVKSRRAPKPTGTTTTTGTGTHDGTHDVTGTGTANGSRPALTTGTGTTATRTRAATRRDTGTAATGTSARASAGTSAGPGGSAGRDQAREHWDTERAAGRLPSGADLARIGGVHDSLGRRWRRAFLKYDTTETHPGTTTGTGTDSDSQTGTPTGHGTADGTDDQTDDLAENRADRAEDGRAA